VQPNALVRVYVFFSPGPPPPEVAEADKTGVRIDFEVRLHAPPLGFVCGVSD